MKKFFIQCLSAFILSRDKRKAFRKRHLGGANTASNPTKAKTYRTHLDADLKLNQIEVPMNANIRISVRGTGNTIRIHPDIPVDTEIIISICGENNRVDIGNSNHHMNLIMGADDGRWLYDSSFRLGDNSMASMPVTYRMLERDTHISVGSDCMFSWGIEVTCTDHHSVLNEDGEVINRGHAVSIGDSVWIGHCATILKNSIIPDGCIVGTHSVVAKKFEKPNCVIVGNPSRIVKENMFWHKTKPDLYQNPGSKTSVAE